MPTQRILTIVFAVLLLTAGIQRLRAEETERQAEPPIVTHILEADSSVEIVMPEGLKLRLQYTEPEKTPNSQARGRNGVAGFRIQVFSDNNVRTAKNEARKREMTIASRFGHYRTYKIYSAPYWRVRVGDFRSQQDAESAAADMRRAFPAFSKEIRVVRDRVNIVE